MQLLDIKKFKFIKTPFFFFFTVRPCGFHPGSPVSTRVQKHAKSPTIRKNNEEG